jgi:hypothetical protein
VPKLIAFLPLIVLGAIPGAAPAWGAQPIPTCEQGLSTCEAQRDAKMSNFYVGSCEKSYAVCKDTCVWNFEVDKRVYKIRVGLPCIPKK